MRPLVLAALIAALCACSAPNDTSTPAASTPAPASKPTPPPAQTADTPKPAETPAAEAKPQPKEIPEGQCGDQSKLPADQRVANTVKWKTASEQDSFGFEVFRGDSEKGEFAKLNKDPMLGAGTSDETHAYEFRDDTIDPCRSYWYYVESISTSGAREKFTPTFQAPPKRRAPGSAAPAAPAQG
jgi:hypothetical protein